MMAPSSDCDGRVTDLPDQSSSRWWREATLWILVAVAAVAYLSRMTDRPLRGEETRRGLVAIEMMESGDWIVPREQQREFLSRPPLQNWIIAGVAMLRGEVDAWSVRFPSVLSLLLMIVLLYGYTRQFLSPLGASSAALCYATFGQVLEMGWLGETESMYVTIVGGSLILWHWGWTYRWNVTLTWSIGYALAAAGMLAKGPQAPVYFVVSVVGFLLWQRQWRQLFTWSHAAGIAVFLLIWNAWNIPFWMHVGTESMIQMYRNDISLRFNDNSWTPLLVHVATYPLEIGVCLLPWSLILFAFVMPGFWKDSRRFQSHFAFHILAISLTFLSVWWVVGAKSRYFMPMYPCFAVLVAITIQRCMDWQQACSANRRPLWIGSYHRFKLGSFAVMMIAMIGLVVVMIRPQVFALSVDATHLVSMFGATAICAVFLFRALKCEPIEPTAPSNQRTMGMAAGREFQGLVAMGAFVWIGYFGIAIDPIIHSTLAIGDQVAKIRSEVPPQQTLRSAGTIAHVFTYHYGQTIPVVATEAESWSQDVQYVCYFKDRRPADLRSEQWVQVAEVPVENDKEDPRSIVVARRVNTRLAEVPVQQDRIQR
ncbi:Undecaprenyl phosphate-alpha-4-amino-4-deoxy-L-arabinose arabinosyl transferase [Rubripirellula lacrimiformis]|uniref:Undecaprenyl phosphate-alpha-4-amino-4-deoxy-L-arabinose arabinosyl transferase n=1 Tax=Rubripirellula lacrimiformis TaxID=1930273 RepID=A0A517N6C1_9BACT|nr:glycosyltransferase family 39 protein [Rubripirellula lacrimiformis]QDT02685.1 Undecaprenyl phosphate-alpha-4-amino-4-deoxy-L-arabinose arabinosyl transferase [Rubripirellula lacrimiformis]